MAIVHSELSEDIDRLVANPAVAALYREWIAASSPSALPALALFEPKARPAEAGNLMVLEPDDRSLRYTYYGPEIAQAAGFDMTGRRTLEFGGDLGAFVEQKYRSVLAAGRPLYVVANGSANSAVVNWERLMLPVRRADGEAVLVCYSSPLVRKAEVLDGLMAASMDGIIVLQPLRDAAGAIADFRYLMVNGRAGEILNRAPDTLVGGSISTAFPQASHRVPVYREVMESGEPRQFEIEAELDGTQRAFRLSAVRAGDQLVVTLADITELHGLLRRLEQQQAELQYANETLEDQASNLVSLVETTEQARGDALAAERFVADLMESVPVPLFYWDQDGVLKRSNRHYAAVYGQSTETIVGKRPEDLLPPHIARFLREQNARLFSGEETVQDYEGDVDVPGRGRRRFVVHRALMRDPAERPIGIAGAMLDLTDEYELRRELERLASTDPLTGLYNRRVFMERLEESIARFRRHAHPTSVALLDIDHFKRVNDSFGHDFGDEVLVGLARLLREGVRDGLDIVARLGGEEFAILMPDTPEGDAGRLAERLRAAFAGTEFATPSDSRRFTASFGVASLSEADDISGLLRRADEALYRSKSKGRNRVTLAGSGPDAREAAAC